MKSNTVLLFTRNGMGQGPQGLQLALAGKYLALTLESGEIPGKILFYTEAVKLACQGSPVLEALAKLEALGCELVLCKTCLDTYDLSGEVRVGIVGGMADILEALQ